MLFYSISFLFTLLLFLGIITCVHLFDCLFLGNFYKLDLYSRFNLSDSIINWFNFYWTSNLYLSLVFFFIFILLLGFFRSSFVLVLVFCFFGFSFWIFELTNFLFTNNNYSQDNLFMSEINTLLTNNLNKYHPLILYLSAFSSPILFLYVPLTINRNLSFNYISQFINFQKWIPTFLFTIFSALFLGSWWALQEGTWGGWWNWDASEVLGLLVFLYFYIELHSYQTFYYFWRKQVKIQNFLLIILLSYYFIQLNFELTSHSFGTRFNHFFNNHMFFLVMSTLLTISIYQSFKNWNWTLIQNYGLSLSFLPPLSINNTKYYGIVLGMILTGTLVFFSYTPLINYFFWQFFKFNSFNWITSLEFTSFIAMFLILVLFQAQTKKLQTPLIILLLTNSSQIWHLFSFPLLRTHSLFSLLHLTVILFFTNSLVNPIYQLAYMWTGTHPYFFTDSNYVINKIHSCFNCQNFFIDSTTIYTSFNVHKTTSFNFFYKSNALKLNEFYLYLNTDVFIGSFLVGNAFTPHSLLLELPTFLTAVESCWLFFMFFVYSISTNRRIVSLNI